MRGEDGNLPLVTMPSTHTKLPRHEAARVLGVRCFEPKLAEGGGGEFTFTPSLSHLPPLKSNIEVFKLFTISCIYNEHQISDSTL